MRDSADALEIHNLSPEPADEWRRLLRFVGLNAEDRRAMSRTVEALMHRAPEMVVDTYNYLQSVPETAAVLGWEAGFDEAHLEERRRFFTVWLARVLGMDTSDEFATYLFRAGKYHAAHGPRHIHVPPAYVTTSIGLVGAALLSTYAYAQMFQEIGTQYDLDWRMLAAQAYVESSLDPTNQQIQREIDTELKRISNRLSFLESTRSGLDAYQKGDYQAAMEAFEAALLVDPQNPTVKEYHKKSIVRAFATFKNLEGDVEKTYLQGVDLYVEGKYEQAIAIWQRILEKDPLNKRVLKAIDKAEDQIRQRDEAKGRKK